MVSTETQELLNICEQLPAAQRVEVADFARFLLAKNATATAKLETDQWLVKARGVAKPGVTTDQIMAQTRGEP